ncbi:MAG: glycosyltransferase [Polyangiaceae bacterium]|jgi:glycosyltransferase involved in cell wall biosynthesis
MDRFVLVVPCYNEQDRLDVREFQTAQLRHARIEFVFVDDGSRDATREVIERIREGRPSDVRVVAYGNNQGKAEAVRLGTLEALKTGPDAVGYWDADLATPLSELEGFAQILETKPGVDVVMGSRVQLMGRDIRRRAWRHYAGRVFATAASVTIGLPVYDTQCGAKLFRVTERLSKVFERPFVSRWIFDVEILARFIALDPRGASGVSEAIVEYPLDRWMDVRGSKLKTVDFLRAASELGLIRRTYGGSLGRERSP